MDLQDYCRFMGADMRDDRLIAETTGCVVCEGLAIVFSICNVCRERLVGVLIVIFLYSLCYICGVRLEMFSGE